MEFCLLYMTAGSAEEARRIGALAHQQAGRRGRRERHGRQELRVVGKPEASMRELGPPLVEDELALAVALHVEGRAAQQFSILVEGDVARLPATLGPDASRLLEPRKELPGEERRHALGRERPPRALPQVLHRLVRPELDHRGAGRRHHGPGVPRGQRPG